jgi:hypothetical protein
LRADIQTLECIFRNIHPVLRVLFALSSGELVKTDGTYIKIAARGHQQKEVLADWRPNKR